MRSPMTTLCYVEKDDAYLMLHRISKKNDVNKDKWIGIGGHFEEGESPEECLLREAYEETLAWVPKKDLPKLRLWAGDLIFLKLLRDEAPFFSLKLTYQGDALVEAVLNGKVISIDFSCADLV